MSKLSLEFIPLDIWIPRLGEFFLLDGGNTTLYQLIEQRGDRWIDRAFETDTGEVNLNYHCGTAFKFDINLKPKPVRIVAGELVLPAKFSLEPLMVVPQRDYARHVRGW